MGFTESVRTCLTKYASFSGRASRPEFWWYSLFFALCQLVIYLVIIITNSAIPEIFFLALILPSLAVQVRRLHDSGRSGWWILIGLIPYLGAIILLIFACQSSVPVTTQYGPPPSWIGQNVRI